MKLLDLIWMQSGAVGPFGPKLARWVDLVAAGLEEARLRRSAEEPIPQVYVLDGLPIEPGDRPETAVPFKGRGSLFRRLEQALGGGDGERTTLLLYGQRRTGKTSALKQLPRRLGSHCVPVFLDMQDLATAEKLTGLIEGIAARSCEEALRHAGLRLPLLNWAELRGDPYAAFRRWLDLVERALGERMLLVCLDEFEELEHGIASGRFDMRILATLRSIVQHRRRIAVLLAGSHRIDELPPHWASALVTTATLPISFLEEADARELIEQPVADFPPIYAPAVVDRIVKLTNGQPYLVQLLCGLLVERMNKARRMPPESLVTEEDVAVVVPLALEWGQSYFCDLWRTQIDVAGRYVLALLARAPGERMKTAALCAALRDAAALDAGLHMLLAREVIVQEGDSFRVSVPLVAEYARRQALV